MNLNMSLNEVDRNSERLRNGLPKYFNLKTATASQLHITCSEYSSSSKQSLQMDWSLKPSLPIWYRRVQCPVRRPVSILRFRGPLSKFYLLRSKREYLV
jgi:hypothetical protein